VTGTQTRQKSPARQAAGIERIEAEAWAQLHQSMPAAQRQRMGVEVHRYGSAVALITARSGTLAVNRVIGLGFDEPLREARIDEIIARYRTAGSSRFLIQWSPEAWPTTVPEWLGTRGFRLIPPTVKFLRGPLRDGEKSTAYSDLRVMEIGPDEADLYEATVAEPLGVPEELSAGIRSTVGHPGWRYYLAFDGNQAVAGAAMYSENQGAWCGLTATMETHRARGAQSSLLGRRVADATADGCWCITADTIPDTPERRNPSFHNMRRAGFEVLYDRANYMLEL
jgi:hypothetical protein